MLDMYLNLSLKQASRQPAAKPMTCWSPMCAASARIARSHSSFTVGSTAELKSISAEAIRRRSPLTLASPEVRAANASPAQQATRGQTRHRRRSAGTNDAARAPASRALPTAPGDNRPHEDASAADKACLTQDPSVARGRSHAATRADGRRARRTAWQPEARSGGDAAWL